jgi:hypothetical protein
MRYRGVPDDLVELAQRAAAGSDFDMLVDNFIDFNKNLVKKGKRSEAMVHFQVPPPIIGEATKNGDVMDAFLAAMTEKLFLDWNMGDPPQWINLSSRFLNRPHYTIQTRSVEFMEKLRQISPEPFKKRNLFYTERVLDRC